MSKKTLLTGIASLFAIAAVVVVLPVAQSSATGDQELKFVERATAVTPVDLGPAGPSAGDQLVVDNPLYDETNTTELGKLSGSCVQTGASATVYHCTATLVLEDGQIALEGLTDLAEPTGYIPVVGGSGVYNKVKGQVFVDQSNPAAVKLTVEL